MRAHLQPGHDRFLANHDPYPTRTELPCPTREPCRACASIARRGHLVCGGCRC